MVWVHKEPITIVAGIDEAGFGPVLGPLLVCASAFSVPSSVAADSMWKSLAGTVTKKASKKAATIAIGDSKKLYGGLKDPKGLQRLERGVLTMMRAGGKSVSNLDEFLSAVCPDAIDSRKNYKWYDQQLTLPLQAGVNDLALMSNALSSAMVRAGISLEMLEAQTVFEGEFNNLLARTNNKSTTLFDITSRLLQRIWTKFPGRHMIINVDRQGGRARYLPVLERIFDGCEFKIIDETKTLSAYGVRCSDTYAEIRFTVGADDQHLPVALASMLAKYLRELWMTLFNQWWASRVANLEPTAGYYTDGGRFYKMIAPTAQAMGIAHDMIYRNR